MLFIRTLSHVTVHVSQIAELRDRSSEPRIRIGSRCFMSHVGSEAGSMSRRV